MLCCDGGKKKLPANSSSDDGGIAWDDEISEHNVNPSTFVEGSFMNSRGLSLRAYKSLRTEPTRKARGVVISVHGIRAHALYELLTAVRGFLPCATTGGECLG